MMFLNASRTFQPDCYDDSVEWLKFVTLWPFDPDYGPWPD